MCPNKIRRSPKKIKPKYFNDRLFKSFEEGFKKTFPGVFPLLEDSQFIKERCERNNSYRYYNSFDTRALLTSTLGSFVYVDKHLNICSIEDTIYELVFKAKNAIEVIRHVGIVEIDGLVYKLSKKLIETNSNYKNPLNEYYTLQLEII
jgi:hypothetical protein